MAAVETLQIHQPSQRELRLAQEVGTLTHQLKQLRAHYLAEGVKPARGCSFATVHAGDADILVEYEHQPYEAANLDVESRGVGPGTPEGVCIVNVLVNGKFIDPREIASEETVGAWEEAVLEGLS